MKKQVFMRWFGCLLEYIMVFPVLLAIAAFTLPQDITLVFTLVLPLHMLVAITITSLLKKFRNFLVAIITIVYIAGATWLWQLTSMSGMDWELAVTITGTAFFFIWGIRAGIGEDIRALFSYFIGLAVHAICLFMFNRAPLLLPFQNIAVAAAMIYVISGIPLANRRFLIYESRLKNSIQSIPGSVVRGNKIIVIILILGIVLLSFWETFLNAVIFVFEKMAWLIGKVIEFLSSVYQPAGEGAPGEQPQIMLPPAEESNSIVPLILNIIGILLLSTVFFFFVRYIVKNFKRIYSAIYDFLSAFLNRFQKWSATEQGYFDRQESLLKTDVPKRQSLLKRFFSREPRWKDMKDNSSRIRFLYAKFVTENIRKGFHYNASETPNETVGRIEINEKEKLIRKEADRNKGKDSSNDRQNEIIQKTNQDVKKDINKLKNHNDIRDAYNQVRYGYKEPDNETVQTLKDVYL